MKKKLFMLLALAVMTLTASAEAGYDLKVGTSEHGTITFKVGDNANAQYADEGDVVTVTITPDENWTVEPSGQWIAAVATSRGQRAPIDLLNKVEFTPVEGQDNQWQFTMKRANVEVSASYRKILTHQDITVENIGVLVNNGGGLTPTLVVKDGDKVLTLGTDYTVQLQKRVSGIEWVDANELGLGEFRYVITGIGKYNGTIYTDEFQPYAIYVFYESGETRGYLNVTHEGPDSKRVVTISVEPREGFQLKDIVAKFGDEEIPLTKITDTEPWEVTCYTFIMPVGNVMVYPTFDVYENTATGVGELKNSTIEEFNIYDLSGRKVSKAVKGVYIQNGKKVVVK